MSKSILWEFCGGNLSEISFWQFSCGILSKKIFCEFCGGCLSGDKIAGAEMQGKDR